MAHETQNAKEPHVGRSDCLAFSASKKLQLPKNFRQIGRGHEKTLN